MRIKSDITSVFFWIEKIPSPEVASPTLYKDEKLFVLNEVQLHL